MMTDGAFFCAIIPDVGLISLLSAVTALRVL